MMTNKAEVTSLISKFSRQLSRPDGSTYSALLLSEAQYIAQKVKTTLFEIEQEALIAGVLPERYSRNQKTLNCADQLKLLQSHIAIVGLGGLGGTVTEIMTRIGVGQITLIDGDIFDESNLNRQLLSSVSNLGKAKAKEAVKRVEQINPATQTYAVVEYFSAENSSRLLSNIDLAIDCLDTITDRFVLEQGCKDMHIPLVSAALGGTSGQATVVYPEDEGFKNIYNFSTSRKRGIEASIGTLPFTALYMAAVECAEVTTMLLKEKSTLKNKLFIAEVADHSTETFQLK